MSGAEAAARRDVMLMFADWAGQGDPPTMESIERIVSSHGLFPVEHYAEEFSREALLIYLGVAWGAGPKARWRDKLRRWAKERTA